MSNFFTLLEASKLNALHQTKLRGRSFSPPHERSRSGLRLRDDANKDLRWSITNHDPLERVHRWNTKGERVDKEDGHLDEEWEYNGSEEEHMSDDDSNEKFSYEYSTNILPNYACDDDLINEVAKSLEKTGLSGPQRRRKSQVESYIASNRKGDKEADKGSDAKPSGQEDYDSYRKKVTSPQEENEGLQTGDPQVKSDFAAPYTSAAEDKADTEVASKLNETIEEGEIDSNREQSRVIQVITRGNFFNLVSKNTKTKTFLLCTDFSPESFFALEWCLGTVLVDGSVLFVVCVLEENDSGPNGKGAAKNDAQKEEIRRQLLDRLRNQILGLLRLTKLQIHIVLEVVHHPVPRHLIVEIIDNLQPILVVVGSRGQTAIKGVLLGSLSNYLVTKLTVPVMVVREKLKKITKYKSSASIFSNNVRPLTLSEAKID